MAKPPPKKPGINTPDSPAKNHPPAVDTPDTARRLITWPADRLHQLIPLEIDSGLFISPDGRICTDSENEGHFLVEPRYLHTLGQRRCCCRQYRKTQMVPCVCHCRLPKDCNELTLTGIECLKRGAPLDTPKDNYESCFHAY
ncbi:hypothetical protein PSH79_08770 [Pseudomonas sp. FP2196]|uniref:hypothetical protein n=1 Tax=Pseudomonas sp. FP2196 TaxID=2954086 RepID=UPI0027347EA4|nr:hypothetical protein [Pseudomonas sp. FP2196]WLH37381.1 hypothetical protein PSH79_08770 [Pseudomonas sp. FP2196]